MDTCSPVCGSAGAPWLPDAALYRIALTRSRGDQRTRDYLDRRTTQGLTRRDAIRCLKRILPPAEGSTAGGYAPLAGCHGLGAESQAEVGLVFTIRNMGGIALFLFGTTFLWLTPSFASAGVSTTGAMWAVTGVMALATFVGFMVATWGLFRKASWWEGAAVASAVLGVLVLIPYWFAARHAGETTPEFNVVIHALGDAGVLVLLLVPKLEQWVSGHVLVGH